MHAAIGSFEQAFPAVVERIGIVRREENWRRPLETVRQLSRSAAVAYLGLLRDIFGLPVAFVEARDHAFVLARINNIGIRRIGRDVASFTTAHGIPAGSVNRAFVAAAGNRDRAQVLLGAINVVGGARVRDRMIKLRRRLIILSRPVLAAIQAQR